MRCALNPELCVEILQKNEDWRYLVQNKLGNRFPKHQFSAHCAYS